MSLAFLLVRLALAFSFVLAQPIELLLGLILLGLLALEGQVLFETLRQQGRLLLQIEALEAQLADHDTPAADGHEETAVQGSLMVPRVGEPAPEFTLPDLTGKNIALADFRGSSILLLFWSPGYSFCRQMLPDLKAWETSSPGSTPKMLIISTGTVEENQTMELQSPVLLDRDFTVWHQFATKGTPTAVLVDAEGKFASTLVEGVVAIQKLVASMAISTQPTAAREQIELTIGMACYNDYDGLYFTLQALRLYQDLEHTELLVIDNYGCEDTKNLVEGWLGARYIRATDVTGTAAPRDLVFREARGNAVLCCDCHILFAPGAIAQLKQFYREHPDCSDLLQGPLLYDDGKLIATHFDPCWRDQMWGTWASDARGEDPKGEPFEIPMQGLGVFSCRKAAWLGFSPEFRGFGGEEGYIHEKFRQAGRRCLCLPWLRWMHRFSRPSHVKYRVAVEDKLRNYVIGHAELGLDLVPVLRHFSQYLPQEQVLAITKQVLGGQWTGSSLLFEEDMCVYATRAR